MDKPTVYIETTKAIKDALHVAVAAVGELQYLLTWNLPPRQRGAAQSDRGDMP